MDLIKKIEARDAKIGIIGLAYVGLPLVIRFCEENFHVVGFDIDPKKVEKLNRGQSYIKHIQSGKIMSLRDNNMFEATNICRNASLSESCHEKCRAFRKTIKSV